jgi:Domain of unknown function (DUF4397)
VLAGGASVSYGIGSPAGVVRAGMSSPGRPVSKRNLATAMVLAAVAVSVACWMPDGPERPAAPTTGTRMRLLHASASQIPLDVIVDNIVVIQDMRYAGASAYIHVDSGPHQLSFRVSGSTSTLFSSPAFFRAETPYTLVPISAGALIGALFFPDTGALPADGRVKLRVINAAVTSPPMDVLLGLPDEPSEIIMYYPSPFASLSEWREGLPGTWRVRFRAQRDSTLLADTGPITLASGRSRTVVLMDRPGGGVTVAVLVDRR